MKKTLTAILTLLLLFSFTACGNILRGTDALIKKARKEIPISEADTIDMQYAGEYSINGKALLWFISGNEYQEHYYYAMECEAKDDFYKFSRSCKHMERAEDIALYQWEGGYCFLVNNRDCAAVNITDTYGKTVTFEIKEDEYPYICFYECELSEYYFTDINGDILPER